MATNLPGGKRGRPIITDTLNDNYCIIPQADEPRLLLIGRETGWMLPQHHEVQARDINEAMKEQIGIDVTVLYCAYDRNKDDEREDQHRVYAMENHSPAWTPPDSGRWIGREDLDQITLAIPEHRAVLAQWLDEHVSGNIPAQRLPWARNGWFAIISSWIEEQCASLGYHISGPFEQMSISAWSSIARVPTTTGDLYFKASAPVFAYEPALTQFLARQWPAQTPPVLAIDRQRCWMLMKDAGVPLGITYEVEVSRLEEMLAVYAGVQGESAGCIDEILAVGCPDRRLNLLPALYEEVLSRPSLLHIGEEMGLPEAEYEQLLAFTPRLRAMCDALASYNVPETLHHDDFHSRNVMAHGDDYIFFDWAECCLAHPFYSMVVALRDAKYILEYDEDMLERLRHAYLAQWTRYEPMERLREAFAIAQPLGKLCRAITWYQLIQRLEPAERWEFEYALPGWLRIFLGTEE